MHADNDSEYELMLGNKQLLGLLFITFVLLGVFFAMGYAMGRNSVPTAPVTAASPTPTPTPRTDTARPPVIEGPVGTQEPTPTTPATIPAPQAEQQAQAEPEPAKRPEPEPTVAPTTLAEPKPGETYLQISANKRPEAELLVEVLTRKGFRAILAESPREDYLRVLVGPGKDEADLARLKSELEKAGFKPQPRRY